MEIDPSWNKLIQEKIEENKTIFLTHKQFELLIKDIVSHPNSPILNLRYEIKCDNCPFSTYQLGLEGKGTPYRYRIELKDTRDSLCIILYWLRSENYSINSLKELLQQLFESFWKPSLRTRSAGMPDLKRDIKVSVIAENTLKVYGRRKITCSVLFCDIDNFKNINDTHGHEYGDRVILKIGDIIESVSKDEAIALHNGGDEFVLIVFTGDAGNIKILIDKINQEIKKYQISISIGIAATKYGSEDILFSDLLKKADMDLLKNAKKKKDSPKL